MTLRPMRKNEAIALVIGFVIIGFAVGVVDALWFDLAGTIALSALLVYGLTHRRTRPTDPRPTWTWTQIVLLASAMFAIMFLIVFVHTPWLDRLWTLVGTASVLGYLILVRREVRLEPRTKSERPT